MTTAENHSHDETQLFEVSTLYGAATLAAALDAGCFGPAGPGLRRVLLVSQNAAVPEVAGRLQEMTGWATLAARFDTVLDWNAVISPLHPGGWTPAEQDLPVWQRLLTESWGLTGRLTLAVESVHAPPAAGLAAIFADAEVHVYADGLMSYGPTREKLPQTVACRIQRLLHLDLVPGLRPLLLSEYGVPAEPVPDAAFRAVLDEISAAGPAAVPGDEGPTAVLLGQYLAALHLLTAEEEEALHERMLRGAVAAGHRRVLFKPHPTAPGSYSRRLEKAAADAGAELTVLTTPMLAETVFDRYRPALVVGCFSTAMFTAAVHYRIPIARVGTELLLERIAPYQNSNRVPLTLVDALVPEPAGEGSGALPSADAAERVAPLVRAVGYCMQPKLYPRLRGEAESWLAAHLTPATARYFKRRRLTSLDLPGSLVPRRLHRLPGGPLAIRVLRRAKRTLTPRQD